MYQYTKDNQSFLSKMDLKEKGYAITEELPSEGPVYYLYEDDAITAEGIHLILDPVFLETHHNSLAGVLSKLPEFVHTLIKEERLFGCNILKQSPFLEPLKKGYKMHVLGLGDVGGMMLSALRLIGGETLAEIGIYDLDDNKMQRWLYELNQINTIDRGPFPPVKAVALDSLFDCDVFVFTASSQIPEVGSDVKDVRMFQLEKNTKIIEIYAKLAAKNNFKGQFIVVSDPVDLLCKAVLWKGEGGLLPEQIKGFGLGVMHARASYYAAQNKIQAYATHGRAYGPHGQHLIIANNIFDYDDAQSRFLTEKTIKANLDVRAVGYKPYIAPALSSAAMSILAYLQGKDHYSTVYIDGVYFGCKNRSLHLNVMSVEKHVVDPVLLTRLENTYKELDTFEF